MALKVLYVLASVHFFPAIVPHHIYPGILVIYGTCYIHLCFYVFAHAVSSTENVTPHPISFSSAVYAHHYSIPFLRAQLKCFHCKTLLSPTFK